MTLHAPPPYLLWIGDAIIWGCVAWNLINLKRSRKLMAELRNMRNKVLPKQIEHLERLAQSACPWCALADAEFRERIAGGEMELRNGAGKVCTFSIDQLTVHPEEDGQHAILAPAPIGSTAMPCAAIEVRKLAREMFDDFMKSEAA